MNQLDMFDLEEKENSSQAEDMVFQDGGRVKVKKINDKEALELEPEDYYYLKDFENKKGVVNSASKNPKNGTISYRVDFDRDKFGFFYGKDLVSLDD